MKSNDSRKCSGLTAPTVERNAALVTCNAAESNTETTPLFVLMLRSIGYAHL